MKKFMLWLWKRNKKPPVLKGHPPYYSLVVANKILDIADENGIELTIMQLLKLLYISNGWWLHYSRDTPLIEDEPEAWRVAPVYVNVYHAFHNPQDGRVKAVTTRAKDPTTGFVYDSRFNDEVEAILRQVVKSYGRFSSATLSRYLCEGETPWKIILHRQGVYSKIPNRLIRQQFDEIRRVHEATK